MRINEVPSICPSMLAEGCDDLEEVLFVLPSPRFLTPSLSSQ